VNQRLTTVIAIAAPIVFTAGLLAVVLHSGRHGPPHPKDWDPRVLDIVKFDEQHRGLTYKQPVFVDFLSPADYSARARTDESALTDEAKAQLETTAGELRALGLSDSKVDLFAASNTLVDTGTLAFYDPDTQRVIIRGTEMTVDLRVTLAHEFTHVLQDQYFGVGRQRTSAFKTSQEGTAFRAILEGDAVRIENEYIDSLSSDEKAQYDQAHQKEVDNATAGLTSVPVALQALQAAPYILGPPFMQLLDAEGHQTEVDAAFRTPPATDEQLFDPRAFFKHDKPLDVAAPSLPSNVPKEDQTDSGDFGATSWYLVLAERIDPLDALRAVDGWGGDSYIAYTQGGLTCVQLHWKGDTPTDDQEMHDALDQWVAAMPPAAAARVSTDGDLLSLASCDAGPRGGLKLNNRALDAIQVPGARSEFMFEAVSQGGLDTSKAFDFGDCVVHSVTFDQFVVQDKPAFQKAYTDCVDKVGG